MRLNWATVRDVYREIWGDETMKRLTILIVSFIGLAFLLGVCGCSKSKVVVVEDYPVYDARSPAPPPGPPPWAPAHGYRAKYHYYYYPASYVYFDVERRLYFYYGGDQWKVSVSLPAEIRINTADYVVLDMETDKPYRYHTDVVKHYPPGQAKKLKKEKHEEKDDD